MISSFVVVVVFVLFFVLCVVCVCVCACVGSSDPGLHRLGQTGEASVSTPGIGGAASGSVC